MNFTGQNPRRLIVSDVIHPAGIIQNGRHVGGQEGAAVRLPDDHGAVLSGRIDFSRIIPEHQGQRVAAAHAHHHAVDGVDRSDPVFLQIIIDQLDGDLRIRVAVEDVAVPQEFLLQLFLVFDDPVVNAHDGGGGFCISPLRITPADVRMRVFFIGLAVGRPPGMPDPAETGERFPLLCFLLQILQPPGGLDHPDRAVFAKDSHPGGIIAPVFQLREPLQKDARSFLLPRISDNSAHVCLSF